MGAKLAVEGNEITWRIPKWFPDLDESVQKLLKEYHSELLRFNQKVNLISPSTVHQSDQVHFADSLNGLELILQKDIVGPVYDIGSGNGFPGLVLGILASKSRPDLEIVLVDSDRRKCEFLKHMTHQLGLEKVSVQSRRVEDLPQDSAKTIVSRAFAPLGKFMVICRDVLCQGGNAYVFKSDSWGSEIMSAPPQVGRFWQPQLSGTYRLPETTTELVIVELKKL